MRAEAISNELAIGLLPHSRPGSFQDFPLTRQADPPVQFGCRLSTRSGLLASFYFVYHIVLFCLAIFCMNPYDFIAGSQKRATRRRRAALQCPLNRFSNRRDGAVPIEVPSAVSPFRRLASRLATNDAARGSALPLSPRSSSALPPDECSGSVLPPDERSGDCPADNYPHDASLPGSSNAPPPGDMPER